MTSPLKLLHTRSHHLLDVNLPLCRHETTVTLNRHCRHQPCKTSTLTQLLPFERITLNKLCIFNRNNSIIITPQLRVRVRCEERANFCRIGQTHDVNM